MRVTVSNLIAVSFLLTVVLIWRRFDQDIKLATTRAAHGSVLITTRCGTIEYQEAGTGVPLLMVHGSGGGTTKVWHLWALSRERAFG